MRYVDGMYFKSADEANDWLAFDTSGQEIEDRSYAENDRFGEWEQWRSWATETATMHTCPYAEDINDDHEPHCWCSPQQMQQCADDI